jgi:iron complex outermembrane receptor protein
MRKKFYCIPVLIGLLGVSASHAQTLENTEDPYSLTLEELMNIPINSASKKDETVFQAPLSSFTITRADIQQAGSTSIMEALRLAPGVIVREQTNGNYDIHIRGFDNILRTSGGAEKNSLATLVMIDNRPVFNNNLGGTAWETLPIDLNDVERIEIVRGPSAPLFGPNAVAGVINIITKRVSEKRHAYATLQYGSPGTLIGQGSYGQRITDKLSLSGSVNFSERERFQEKYFSPAAGGYVDLSNDPIHSKRYPNLDRAVQKWGANTFLNYTVNDKVNLDLSLGLQRSDAQKVLLGTDEIPLTTNITESQYANLSVKAYGLHVRSSYVNGSDQLNVGATPNGNEYNTFDVIAEFPVQITDKITLTPGLAYQTAAISDEKYTVDGDKRTGYLNGSVDINSSAAFLRADLNLTNNWRLITAGRADKFSAPDKTTFAYEFASTYQLGKKHIVHAAVTRSNAGAFIGQAFANYDIERAPGYVIHAQGSDDYELFRIQMVEVGYRVKVAKGLQLDLDVFRQKADNFASYLITEFAPSPPFPAYSPSTLTFQNVPTEAVQTGATLSVNIVPHEKLQIRTFVTLQKTNVENLPDAKISPDVMPGLTYSDKKHGNTPASYGGYFINYKISDKFYVNLNGYYFHKHTQYDASDPNGEGKYSEIKGKMLVNMKINYSPITKFNVFLNGRNLLNQDNREFFGTDRTGTTLMAGASYSL